MTFPTRITFQWLIRALQGVTSVQEFDAIVAELQRRNWRGLTPGENFLGIVEALTPRQFHKQIVARRQ
jgi:hypothetical protein